MTLRRFLSHTAGITVHGFPGYAVDVPRPTLVQVFNGEKPAIRGRSAWTSCRAANGVIPAVDIR